MPNVFMATILDTPNPSGGVHSMFKQPAGSRLAREGLKHAYGMDLVTSPRVATVAHGGGDTATVTLTTGGAMLRNTSGWGFEVRVPGCLVNSKACKDAPAGTSTWINAPIQSAVNNTITVGSVPQNATRIRYEDRRWTRCTNITMVML